MPSFKYERMLQWSECDPAGIIFFPNYIRWMVDGVNQLLLAAGVDPNEPDEGGTIGGLPSVGLAATFLAPLHLHQALTHEISVTKIGTSSIVFTHRFVRDGICLAKCEDTRVCVVHGSRGQEGARPRPIPSELRRVLLNHIEEGEPAA